MRHLKTVLIYLLLPALFYPIYFVAANVVDTFFGDQLLINWLQFESKSLLLKTFFSDWLTALPVMYGLYYVVILPIKLLAARFRINHISATAFICAIVICALSLALGFRNLALISNGISTFIFVSFYMASIRISMRIS